MENAENTKYVAFVKCAGDCEKQKDVYEYVGPRDCKLAQNNPNSGPKACTYGCTGYGSCKAVCEFGAIDIIDGIAVINKEKCKACGKCVTECPRHLIELVPYDAERLVRCNSHDKGLQIKAPAAQVVSDVPCVQETVRLEPSPWIEILPTSIQRNVQIVAYAKTSAQLKLYRKKDPPQGGRFLTMKQTPREAPLMRLHYNIVRRI